MTEPDSKSAVNCAKKPEWFSSSTTSRSPDRYPNPPFSIIILVIVLVWMPKIVTYWSIISKTNLYLWDISARKAWLCWNIQRKCIRPRNFMIVHFNHILPLNIACLQRYISIFQSKNLKNIRTKTQSLQINIRKNVAWALIISISTEVKRTVIWNKYKKFRCWNCIETWCKDQEWFDHSSETEWAL